MRGYKDWNFPLFDRAERIWKEGGHQPFSPAQMDRVLGYDPAHPITPEHIRHVINLDLQCVLAADAVAVLPGWERSKGACVEVALARFLDLPLYDALTGELLDQLTPNGELFDAPSHAERKHGLPGTGLGYTHEFDPDLAAQ